MVSIIIVMEKVNCILWNFEDQLYHRKAVGRGSSSSSETRGSSKVKKMSLDYLKFESSVELLELNFMVSEISEESRQETGGPHKAYLIYNV